MSEQYQPYVAVVYLNPDLILDGIPGMEIFRGKVTDHPEGLDVQRPSWFGADGWTGITGEIEVEEIQIVPTCLEVGFAADMHLVLIDWRRISGWVRWPGVGMIAKVERILPTGDNLPLTKEIIRNVIENPDMY